MKKVDIPKHPVVNGGILYFNRLAIIVVIVAMATSLIGCATVPPQKPITIQEGDYSYLKEYLNWSILEHIKKYNIKGLSIAVVDDQKIIWEKGFGLADEERNIPASSQTIYRIGSISKVITAIEIMRLQQAGKVNIDDPITDYIKNFSVRSRFKKAKPITLRSLLSHHSGLPSDILAGMWTHNPNTLEELVDQVKNESLASPPHTMYKYSNIGFSVLGRVIEIVEKKSFPQAMAEGVLQPLSMQSSSFTVTPEIEPFYAKGYRDGKEIERTPLRDLPAGSMLSNVVDMGRFIRFLFAKKKMVSTSHDDSEIINGIFKPQYPGIR